MNNNAEQKAVVESEIVSTSVSMDSTLLKLGKLAVNQGRVKKGFSSKVAELVQQDLIAGGWLTPDGEPTEKALEAMAREDKAA